MQQVVNQQVIGAMTGDLSLIPNSMSKRALPCVDLISGNKMNFSKRETLAQTVIHQREQKKNEQRNNSSTSTRSAHNKSGLQRNNTKHYKRNASQDSHEYNNGQLVVGSTYLTPAK